MVTFEEFARYVSNSIQESSVLSALSTDDLRSFAILGLTEEAGEVAGLACRESYKHCAQAEERWLEELGDVLWYFTAVCLVQGFSIEDLVKYNMYKLEERYGKRRE